MARRHVEEGEAHVHKQRRILARLRLHGDRTDLAEELLGRFEQLLEDHRASLERAEEEERQEHRPVGR